MAKCKSCNTNIPDGTEYCENCQDKENAKANESYLDSLLSSVKKPTPSIDNIYKKNKNAEVSNKDSKTTATADKDSNQADAADKDSNQADAADKDSNQAATPDKDSNQAATPDKDSNQADTADKDSNQADITGNEPNQADIFDINLNEEIIIQSDFEEDRDYSLDMEDIKDFDQFNLMDDLEDKNNEIVIDDIELFGEDIDHIFKNEFSENGIEGEISSYSEEQLKIDSLMDNQINEIENNDIAETAYKLENGAASEKSSDESIFDIESTIYPEISSELIDKIHIDDSEESLGLINEDREILESLDSDISKIEDQNIIVESEKEDNMSNTAKGNASDNSQDDSHTGDVYKPEEDENIDDDLNDLLNSLEFSDSEDKVENNTKDKSNRPDVYEQKEVEEAEQDDYLNLLNQTEPDDSVASDVVAINDLLNGIPPKEEMNHAPSNVGEVFSDALKVVSSLHDNIDEDELLSEAVSGNDKKSKKRKLKKDKKDKIESDKPKMESDKPKAGFFKRLFGNVPNENAEKDALKESLAEAEAAKKKALKKANKKAPKGKDAVVATDESEEIGADKTGKDKISKKDESKKAKKEKKENKKKSKEIIQVIDEVEKDEGKINRTGAVVVFIFFSILVAILLIGSNMANYTLSVKNATNYFERQKYTQAYNEVYGITIKDEDIEIYDKIMTVMYVDKQLNSYNNNYYLKDYPKALDSLLKGLERYDKYIELATLLGIKSDLDYVRSQILAELNNKFNLSEEEALEIISYDSIEEYSAKIYDVVDNNMVK